MTQTVRQYLRRSELLALANASQQGDPDATSAILRSFINGNAASRNLVGAGQGILSGTGALCRSAVMRNGDLIKTSMMIDLRGLAVDATDLHVLGVGTSPAYLMQWKGERNGGVPWAGLMTCLEVPTGGGADIDVYMATAGTGKYTDLVTGLAGQALLLDGAGAWTLALGKALANPASLVDAYLYLTAGAGAAAGTFTAGKFLLELIGYDS